MAALKTVNGAVLPDWARGRWSHKRVTERDERDIGFEIATIGSGFTGTASLSRLRIFAVIGQGQLA